MPNVSNVLGELNITIWLDARGKYYNKNNLKARWQRPLPFATKKMVSKLKRYTRETGDLRPHVKTPRAFVVVKR